MTIRASFENIYSHFTANNSHQKHLLAVMFNFFNYQILVAITFFVNVLYDRDVLRLLRLTDNLDECKRVKVNFIFNAKQVCVN